jgi:hypothetical protein
MKQHRERTTLSKDNAHHSLFLKAAIIWERSASISSPWSQQHQPPSSMHITESSLQARVHKIPVRELVTTYSASWSVYQQAVCSISPDNKFVSFGHANFLVALLIVLNTLQPYHNNFFCVFIKSH